MRHDNYYHPNPPRTAKDNAMHDRYDPRILQRNYDLDANAAFERASNSTTATGKDEHPVGNILDRLVGAVNEVEESILGLASKVEPALTPEGPAACGPVGPPIDMAVTSPLVDSIRGQCIRLDDLSAKLRRIRNRVEL